jgi:hypothetical protein
MKHTGEINEKPSANEINLKSYLHIQRRRRPE